MTRSPRRFHLILVALLVAGIAWGGVYGYRAIRARTGLPKNWGVIEAGSIWRSGQPTPAQLRNAQDEFRFKTVLHLGGHRPNDPQAIEERDVCAEIGAKWIPFKLEGDGSGAADVYVEVLSLMNDPDNYPMLVHCGAGAQRTSVASILYKHFKTGEPISKLYPESFEYRHRPEKWALLAYLVDHYEEIRAGYEGRETGLATPIDGGESG